jgi:hypothetical protein
MKQIYKKYNPRSEAKALIEKSNEILEDYASQDFDMTVRQLYYQLVAQDIIQNSQKSYDRIVTIINKARVGGLIDWNYIVDRTRNLQSINHWNSPCEILEIASTQFRVDKWEDQPFRPEVWIEKEALAGVFERVCNELDVPFFACRGYASQSELHVAAKRLERWHRDFNQTPLIFHFGDHDPSGIDMTRDMKDRFEMFSACEIKVERLALNISQIKQYNPPPQLVKPTDSRAKVYIKEFGSNSWELDALNPATLARLVREQINSVIDRDAWQFAEEKQKVGQATLSEISGNFRRVESFLKNSDDNF